MREQFPCWKQRNISYGPGLCIHRNATSVSELSNSSSHETLGIFARNLDVNPLIVFEYGLDSNTEVIGGKRGSLRARTIPGTMKCEDAQVPAHL